MIKTIAVLLAALLAVILGARLAYTWTTSSADTVTDRPWAQAKMEFVAWNGERWTAWIRDGRFELLPRNERKWSRHANTSIAFLDWEGEPWQAKVDGETFLLARRGDWKGPTDQSAAIRYRDWDGKLQVRTVPQLRR